MVPVKRYSVAVPSFFLYSSKESTEIEGFRASSLLMPPFSCSSSGQLDQLLLCPQEDLFCPPRKTLSLGRCAWQFSSIPFPGRFQRMRPRKQSPKSVSELKCEPCASQMCTPVDLPFLASPGYRSGQMSSPVRVSHPIHCLCSGKMREESRKVR